MAIWPQLTKVCNMHINHSLQSVCIGMCVTLVTPLKQVTDTDLFTY